MEIKLIEIKEQDIKAVRKALRKWKFRKTGATINDLGWETGMPYFVVEEILNQMFKEGLVMAVHRYNDNELRYIG